MCIRDRFSTGTLSVSSHSITAEYTNDTNFNGSISAVLLQTVNKADTVTTITSVPPEATVVGQNYTVAFTISAKSPGSGTPTGTVTVSDGSVTCTGAVPGTCSLASTSAGTKTLTATYS